MAKPKKGAQEVAGTMTRRWGKRGYDWTWWNWGIVAVVIFFFVHWIVTDPKIFQENFVRISKKTFYDRGGFSNPFLYRKQLKRGWGYYEVKHIF